MSGTEFGVFFKCITLKQMVDHIYGRANILNAENRPSMFLKELRMYSEYLRKEIKMSMDNTECETAKIF